MLLKLGDQWEKKALATKLYTKRNAVEVVSAW